jgi:hypothetical protein
MLLHWVGNLHLDNDVASELRVLLQLQGHDVTAAEPAGLAYAGDEEQLLFAAQEHRILITHNTEDFVLLHRAWLRWAGAWQIQQRHAGILVVAQVKPRERPILAQAITALLSGSAPRSNQLWQWTPRKGWVQYQPPTR